MNCPKCNYHKVNMLGLCPLCGAHIEVDAIQQQQLQQGITSIDIDTALVWDGYKCPLCFSKIKDVRSTVCSNCGRTMEPVLEVGNYLTKSRLITKSEVERIQAEAVLTEKEPEDIGFFGGLILLGIVCYLIYLAIEYRWLA